MSSEQGGAGRREVAYRVFAAVYDDATLSHTEGEEERAPNYVVTPTGARINRLFVVGVLTEVEPVSDGVLRARVVDPTGAFVLYAGQYQPDAQTFLERVEPPAFVAVTGKARTYSPDDSDRVFTSIRPESINAVDAETRDRWTVGAAEATLDRVAAFGEALDRPERGEDLRRALSAEGVDEGLAAGIPLAIEHYGTTESYLAAVRDVAIQAAELVAGRREEVEPLDVEPDEGGEVEGDLSTGGAAAPEVEPDSGAVESEAPEPDEAEPAGEIEADSTEPGAGDVERDADEPEEPAEPAEAGTTDEGLGDFEEYGDEEMYELDEDERERVEEEFGTEFTAGGEVDEPGEADIETPDPAEFDETEPAAGGGPEADEDPEAGEEAEAEAEAEEVDVEEAVMDAMRDLDEGDGADRDAVIEAVAGEHGLAEDEVADAIQEALMGGKCYEPDEGRLKAI